MSFKVWIYNRITGKPQILTRDIYRWETFFCQDKSIWKFRSSSTTYLKISKMKSENFEKCFYNTQYISILIQSALMFFTENWCQLQTPLFLIFVYCLNDVNILSYSPTILQLLWHAVRNFVQPLLLVWWIMYLPFNNKCIKRLSFPQASSL